jgi:hypothetical protein
MSMDVKGRIHRLINLATHPTANDGEANNAARAACRLIKQHGLLGMVSETAPPPPQSPQPPRGYHVDFVAVDFEDFFGPMNQVRGRWRTRQYAPNPKSVRVEGLHTVRFPPDPNARELLISNAAQCAACQKSIKPPKLVMWSRHEIYHCECYAEAIR